MKKFSILTLFPNLFAEFINTSIIKKAIKNEQISIEIINIRDFADNKHKQVDDYPYGGGAGMVLQALPVINAINAAKKTNLNAKVCLLTPQGQTWKQSLAYQFSHTDHNYIFICGHYEGIDERIMNFIDCEISIGDYVVTGGELPAMLIIDSITRLLPNVITDESHLNDSFNNFLLDYPTYTRPETVLGLKVPEVLINGHHEKIAQFRREQAIIATYNKRKDLLKAASLTPQEKEFLKNYLNQKK